MNNNVIFNEYCGAVPTAIANEKPGCKNMAVIPAITVDDKSGIKNVSNCFVHIANINTTMYIDDKHRMMIVWAGPVEVQNYNISENKLGLRSQLAIDTITGKVVYYTATGEVVVIKG